MRALFCALLAETCCSVALLATPSAAGPPNAANSTIPPVMSVCPQGDLAYAVIIRDVAHAPYHGVNVLFDFSACTGIHLCPPGSPPGYTVVTPTSISVITDMLGTAVLNLQASGVAAGCVRIYADATLMTDGISSPLVSVANADQTGDGVVAADDAALIAAKSANDLTADLDGNGVHNASDNTLLAAHLGHSCPGLVVPIRPGSWGQLKILYR